ncbi:MAG: hypothetical protein K6F92_09510 [Lachnospiraceae bacterium]|nr:hypothetical protein [Lachnospiraceae bacterium]
MKKRELILDFTSLLDVIMIILFLVLGSVNANSLEAADEAKAANLKTQELERINSDLATELENAQKSADKLEEEIDKLKEEITLLKAQLDSSVSDAAYSELQVKYDALLADYEYLKIISDASEYDSKVYEEAIERTGKVILYCTSVMSEEGTAVQFDLYSDADGDGVMEYQDKFLITHDLTMNSAQRTAYKAEMINQATQFLIGSVRDDESDLLWFSIYYDYDDVNISSFDMEVMEGAIDNLEVKFDKRCYYIKFKTTGGENNEKRT